MTQETLRVADAPNLSNTPTTNNPVEALMLGTYDALKLAGQPETILHNLSSYCDPRKVSPSDPRDQQGWPIGSVEVETVELLFTTKGTSHSTASETHENWAVDLGLSEEYGVYSGSVKAHTDSQSNQSATTFNYGFKAHLDLGSVDFTQPGNNTTIRTYLNALLLEKLDGITDLRSARAFVDAYGTHVITGIKLGGKLFVSINAATTSNSSKKTINDKVEAAYKSVASIEATASVTYSLQQQFKEQGYVHKVTALGGTGNAIAGLNPADPSTFTTWMKSCTSESASGVKSSRPLWELAGNDTAKRELKRYMQLMMLKYSLENPSHFSRSASLVPYKHNTVQVTVPENFKVLGGGVEVKPYLCSSFVTSSYPLHDDTKQQVIGWQAISHDLVDAAISENDSLSVYAIAVHDPGNLLGVTCITATGTNTGIGRDNASATLPTDYILTGGGVQTSSAGNSQPKFLFASTPLNQQSWNGQVQDYKFAATNTSMSVYALGVKPPQSLAISPTWTSATQTSVQHGTPIASVRQGASAAGGGFLAEYSSGFGNLLQQCYPSGVSDWQVGTKDLNNQATPADVTAKVLQLKASISGLSG